MEDLLRTTTMEDIISSVEKDASYIENITGGIINEYSRDLDSIMKNIHDEILSIDYPAINTIEKYFMELSNALYFICEKVERLGVYDSLSKAKAQEVYNNTYLGNMCLEGEKGKKPTVAELQAKSENATIYYNSVNSIYSRAYKVLKNKINAAETMVGTLSKVLSHRIQESQLTFSQTERRILNESNAF